jgi:hypothetical protein
MLCVLKKRQQKPEQRLPQQLEQRLPQQSCATSRHLLLTKRARQEQQPRDPLRSSSEQQPRVPLQP